MESLRREILLRRILPRGILLLENVLLGILLLTLKLTRSRALHPRVHDTRIQSADGQGGSGTNLRGRLDQALYLMTMTLNVVTKSGLSDTPMFPKVHLTR